MPFNLDDYQTVEDRLRLFWDRYPAGKVVTELIHHEEGSYIVKALVYRGDELREDRPAATGLAHDSAAQLPANMKASALETCETSAVGRALANLGFAPKGHRPSREEMSKVSAAEAHTGAKPRTTTSTAAESSGPPEGFGEGPEGGPEPSQETHVHGDWTAAPRAGFVICGRQRNGKPCGYAAKNAEVVVT